MSPVVALGVFSLLCFGAAILLLAYTVKQERALNARRLAEVSQRIDDAISV